MNLKEITLYMNGAGAKGAKRSWQRGGMDTWLIRTMVHSIVFLKILLQQLDGKTQFLGGFLGPKVRFWQGAQ